MSNDVASNNIIQKRKYNSGWYFSKSQSVFNKKSENLNQKDENVIAQNKVENNYIINEIEVENVSLISEKISSEKQAKESTQNITSKSEKTVNITEKISTNSNSVENETLFNGVNFNHKKLSAPKKAFYKSSMSTPSKGLLIVLCFFIPWLAVGLATNWDVKTVVINILWTFLCGIPGIIHAIIVVNKNA